MSTAMKTESEVQGFFFSLVKGSPLASAVSGNVYRASADSSYRPRDSRLEDIEVIVTSSSAELQEGVVTVLVYVPDTDPYDNGVKVKDGARTAQLERIAQDWFDTCPESGSEYSLSLTDTIGSIAIPEIGQHAVSVQIRYEIH